YVRGLRKDAGEAIEAERRKNGWFTSIADLIDRVPLINKREIRALSIAGALNFENTIHRRQALWESEFAIQPKGSLFENSRLSRSICGEACLTETSPSDLAAMPPLWSIGGVAADNFPSASEKHSFSTNRAAEPRNTPPTFIKRMEGLELIEA